jgi:hypothetical protein
MTSWLKALREVDDEARTGLDPEAVKERVRDIVPSETSDQAPREQPIGSESAGSFEDASSPP